ncbi:ilGF domain-containing protein [Nephila pilipes]|uniref:IlGF domain-containing protein n=1 Tax=Nephila pilipes TaxID=299642 RepID=A0A8X6QH47_NEPPI|nr:ilGF domain-containing protein [Nephila pilipes]
MMKISALVLVFVLVHFGACVEKRSTVRACGRALSELLSAVCHGNYNGPRTGKRSFPYPIEINGGMFDDSFLKTEEDFFHHQTRVQRGVADECCYRPCSLSTLQSYCG